MPKYFIIAGEASGDMHAAHLLEAISKENPNAEFVGFGGAKMANAGCRLLLHYREMAYMGYVDVILHLNKIIGNIHFAKTSLLQERPDALILIDYPSFNLRIAKYCQRHLPNIPIYYYIPPKVWAWKTWRIHKIARYSQRVFGIFPFEEDFYRQYGYHCEYIGNPTAFAMNEYRAQHDDIHREEHLIALIPGSRRHEIEKCLPRMLQAALRQDGYDIAIAMAPSIEPSLYHSIIDLTVQEPRSRQRITLCDDTYMLMTKATAAVVNSGTATLEAALLRCPQVAVYHLDFGHLLNAVRPWLFKTPYFTLPNIILSTEAVKELLAYLFTADSVDQELKKLLSDHEYRKAQQSYYQEIETRLGTHNPSATAAKEISQTK